MNQSSMEHPLISVYQSNLYLKNCSSTLPILALAYTLLIEGLNITFTSNGKREFVPRDKVSPLLVVYC